MPNGDFEQYVHCPTFASQIDSAKYWMQATNGTVDYYHQCGTGYGNVPNSGGGFQMARSGAAYAGIITWASSNNPWQYWYREYLEVELLSPLQANVCYHFKMYINLINYSRYTHDDIAVHFSDTLIQQNTTSVLPVTPQLQNALGNLPDTLNWTLVSGEYIAHGGEKFLTIGNFNNDFATDTLVVNPSGGNGTIYLYIDDVSLYVCGTNGLSEAEVADKISVFPNPINSLLTISKEDYEPAEFILYNLLSVPQLRTTFKHSVQIGTESLLKGIYLYEIRNAQGRIKVGKLIKE